MISCYAEFDGDGDAKEKNHYPSIDISSRGISKKSRPRALLKTPVSSFVESNRPIGQHFLILHFTLFLIRSLLSLFCVIVETELTQSKSFSAVSFDLLFNL